MSLKRIAQEIEQALDRYGNALPPIREILEKHQEDVTSRDENGCALLHHAAKHCDDRTVGFLLNQHDCNLNARDKNGLTALDYAAVADRGQIVQFMLEHPIVQFITENPECRVGGPLNYRNFGPEGNSSADRARTAGAKSSAAILSQHEQKKIFAALKNADPQAGLADAAGWTALHWAANQGSRKKMERLLEAGANPKQRNEEGESPVWVTIRNGDRKGFEAFRREGIEINGWVHICHFGETLQPKAQAAELALNSGHTGP